MRTEEKARKTMAAKGKRFFRNKLILQRLLGCVTLLEKGSPIVNGLRRGNGSRVFGTTPSGKGFYPGTGIKR
jgi:hypothetical protein